MCFCEYVHIVCVLVVTMPVFVLQEHKARADRATKLYIFVDRYMYTCVLLPQCCVVEWNAAVRLQVCYCCHKRWWVSARFEKFYVLCIFLQLFLKKMWKKYCSHTLRWSICVYATWQYANKNLWLWIRDSTKQERILTRKNNNNNYRTKWKDMPQIKT